MNRAKCWDKNWKYKKACETNIALTFAKERRRVAEEAAKRPAVTANVRQIAAKKASKP